MDETPVWKQLIRLSAPVMLALLIQSIYNIVDSYFVARYSEEGLTALSIIFPIQLLMTALATGTGVGINILISRLDGEGETKSQKNIIAAGFLLSILGALLFTAAGMPGIRIYYQVSSAQALVREYGIQYAQIIFAFSLGMFIEAAGTKVLQARSNMVLPMCAQVAGAAVNIVLDPILIFGYFGLPVMGIRGAAAATVIGQWTAMAIVMAGFIKRYSMPFGRVNLHYCTRVLRAGAPSIIMQCLYTVYIVGLNLILKIFSEDAVTVLGIYYKLQTFFFIPLLGLQQVILPLISFSYGAGRKDRVDSILRCSFVISGVIMVAAAACFMIMPELLLSIFSSRPEILKIGGTAFRIIALSFIPSAFGLIFVVYFQGVDMGKESIFLILLRQVALLVPIAWALHFMGLNRVWFTFPITEVVVVAACLIFYKKRKPLNGRKGEI